MINSAGNDQNFIGQQVTCLSPIKDRDCNRIVWVDMEMSGVDADVDTILEVACVITNENLANIAGELNLVIHHPQDILDNMNEWCKNQHGKSGLTEECLKSNLSMTEAENKLLEFVSKYVAEKASPLAGSSIHVDRSFMKKHMPRLNEYIHYRIIDVSSISELCRRWNPDLYRCYSETDPEHRALPDIKRSIAKLEYYRYNFFRVLC